MSDARQAPHAVYRFYDAEDRLLYVGCSRSPATRRAEHDAMKPWAAQIARTEMEWYECRDDAQRAEGWAIIRERPLHNYMTRSGPHRSRLSTFRIPDDLYRPAQGKAVQRGESVSSVIIRYLDRYARGEV